MKKMTCRQLGGGCDKEFFAETFEEMAKLSREHGKEMYDKGDKAHLEAMEQMKKLMLDPVAVEEWYELKREEFDEQDDIF